MTPKQTSSFLDEPDLAMAPLPVQALVLRCRAGYLRHGYLPDDPRAAAAIAQAQVRDMTRWWDQVRTFFRALGEGLLDDTLEATLLAYESKVEKLRINGGKGGRAKVANAKAIATANAKQKPGSAFVHDLEHAHGAGALPCGVSTSSTQESTSFSPSLSSEGLAAEGEGKPRVKKPRKPRALTPAQARDLSLQEFGWDQDHEAQLQAARAGYPSNQVRLHRDGTKTRCLPGTPEQMRRAWKEILLDHPDLSPRILKACLFAYLDQQERDQERNIVSGIVNLPKFWAADLQMWEVHLGAAKAAVVSSMAAEAGALPLEVANG